MNDDEKYQMIEPFCQCKDCQDPEFAEEMRQLEINLMYGDFEDELEFSVPHSNMEDKIMRVHPELSCSYCPPNKSENFRGNYKSNKLKPLQKNRQKQRNKSRDFKSYQREDLDNA